MANIPVSSVVGVDITIGAQFPQRPGFGTLNIVTAETGVIDRVERSRFYQNIDGVADDWATSTEAYKAANAYFSQQPKPDSLRISTRYPTAQSAVLRGGGVADTAGNLALFTAISNGSFTISIDGASEDITALDFSTGHTDLGDVAATIQTALQAVATGGYTAATCTHTNGRFYITSGTTGASSTISFLTPVSPATGTDISSLLEMQMGEGTKVNGIVAETITASLTAIENVTQDWYGLVFTKEVRDDVVINGENAVEAAAAWVQSRIKVFGNTTNNEDSFDSVSTTDIGAVVKAAGYRRTITTYSSFPSQYPSASALGRAFTVNFNQPNSTITLKFKQLPGITVEALTQNQKAVLDSKNINAFIDVGGNPMYAESFMADGVFFDEVHGVDWLQSAIQTNVFGYTYTRTTKVPLTDPGVASEEQQAIRALDEGRRNGLLAAGTTIDGEYLPNGYKTTVIPVADISQSDKEARQYNGLSFVALGAGAIHGVQINGVFER